MRSILLSISFFTFSIIFSQNNDNSTIKLSTIEKIEKKIDEDKLTHNDSITHYIQLIEKELSRTKSKTKLAKLNYLVANLYRIVPKIDQAIHHNTISYQLNKNNEKELAKNHYFFARMYMRKSDYLNCIHNSLKCIELAKKTKQYKLLQDMSNTLSMFYYQQYEFDKAIELANSAIAYQKDFPHIENKSYSYGILSLNYYEIFLKSNKEADFITSEKHIKYSYDLFTQSNDLYGQAWAICYWSILFEKKDKVKSLNMRLEAERKWKASNTDNSISTLNIGNIGLMYSKLGVEQNNPEFLNKAEDYYLRCLEKTEKQKNKFQINLLKKRLAFLYAKKRKYKEAYEALDYSYKLSDSLFSQENKNKLAKEEVATQMKLKNKEIELNKLKTANEKRQKWFLFSGLILLGIIGTLLFYQSRNRQKTNEKLQQLNAELDEANKAKTRFFSILNHDLRGPVANLIFFLQLQKESPELLDEESIQRMQDKTMTGVENLLASMEDILQWSKSQMQNFKPQPQQFQIATLFEDTQKHFLSEENILFQFENPSNLSLVTDENYLKTIVRNLTGNAVKALANVQNSTITWKAFQENDSTILSITDNGKGASQEEFKALYDEKEVVGIKTGLGLHLIRDLAKAIDCEISVNSEVNEGTIITLKL